MPYLDICPSFIIRKSLILPYGKRTGPERHRYPNGNRFLDGYRLEVGNDW